MTGRVGHEANLRGKALDKGLSVLALLKFGTGSFFVVRGCPVHCRMLSSIAGFHSLDASSILTHLPQVMTTKTVPRFCQMSPENGMGSSYLVENHCSRLTARLVGRPRNRNKQIDLRRARNHELKDFESSYEIRISLLSNNLLHFWEGEKNLSYDMASLNHSSMWTVTCKLVSHCARLHLS